jgi:hypothetical protein
MRSVVEWRKESLAEGMERLGRWGGDVRFMLNMGILSDIANNSRDPGNSAGTVQGETCTKEGFGDAGHSTGKVGEAVTSSTFCKHYQTKGLCVQSQRPRLASSKSLLNLPNPLRTRCTQGDGLLRLEP